MALGGVTVIVQGPQGEDATLTDDKGVYLFTSLAGRHLHDPVLRGERGDAGRAARRPRLAADKMVRVNAKIARRRPGAGAADLRHHRASRPSSTSAARASARPSTSDFMQNVPLARTYGDVIERAPGRLRRSAAATSRSAARPASRTSTSSTASTSPASSTATSRSGTPSHRRRHQPARSSSSTRSTSTAGGYQAEFGGAHGRRRQQRPQVGHQRVPRQRVRVLGALLGVGRPELVTTVGGSLGYVRKPDFDSSIGVEVGRPDHQGQAVLLGRLRAALPGHARVPADLRPASTTRRRCRAQRRRERQPDRRELPELARAASPSHTRRTTTPRRSTGLRRPEHHLTSPRSARPTSTTRCARSTTSSRHLQSGAGRRRS